jgi:hypothetical protein
MSKTQDFKKLWTVRDYVRENASIGISMANVNQKPSALETRYNKNVDPKNAVAFLADKPILSIVELGHIYDPVLVNNAGLAEERGDPKTFCQPGGGRTLRIGQPEESFWSEEGLSATRLLDLFTVKPLDDDGKEIPIQGRININTAPREVLAAAFTGLEINSDEGVEPSKVKPLEIADAIIENRPYSKITDLERVFKDFVNGVNYDPAIENVPAAGAGAIPRMAVMDRMREELFRRTFHLFTTQSRAFSVLVLGQALNAAGDPISSQMLEGGITLDFDEDKVRFIDKTSRRTGF